MPDLPTKASRKAALANPKPNKGKRPFLGRLPANPYDGVEVLAHEQVGLKQFTVTAPLTLTAAHAPEPYGPQSTEFAPAHAVPGQGKRIPFDVDEINADTARLNRQADEDALIRASAELERECRTRGDEEHLAQVQMGDYCDDEGYEEAYIR